MYARPLKPITQVRKAIKDLTSDERDYVLKRRKQDYNNDLRIRKNGRAYTRGSYKHVDSYNEQMTNSIKLKLGEEAFNELFEWWGESPYGPPSEEVV